MRTRRSMKIKNPFNLCGVFLAISAVVLAPLQNSKFYSMSPSSVLQGQANDPCDRGPAGNAYGRTHLCPIVGSSAGIAKGDFNNDGFADLAVGVPLEDNGRNLVDSGAVNVIYGSAVGLTAAGNQFLTEPFISATGLGPQIGNHFGAALAAGDFNNDGFSDLAVAIPDEDVPSSPNSIPDVGAVLIFKGAPEGLSSTGQEFR